MDPFEQAADLMKANNFEQAIDLYSIIIDVIPEHAPSYCWRGVCYFRIQNSNQALTDLLQSITLDPQMHIAYYLLGLFHNDLKLFGKAVEYFTFAISLEPSDYNSFQYRAHSYMSLNLLDSALSDANKAIELNPNASSYNIRGNIHSHMDNLYNAKSDYEKAIELNPEFTEAISNLATILYELEDYEGSVNTASQALTTNPNDAESYNTRGLAFKQLGILETAINDFNHALSLSPKYTAAYLNRGVLYREIGEIDKAITDFNTSLSINSKDHQVYDELANIHLNYKIDYQAAICCTRIAESLQPDHAGYLYQLSNLYLNWNTFDDKTISKYSYLKYYEEFVVDNVLNNNEFLNRFKSAKSFSAKAFLSLFDLMRTDLRKIDDKLILYLFIGSSEYLSYPLTNQSLYFNDVQNFTDKTTDCTLLFPFNQNLTIRPLNFNNVRVRSLCYLESRSEIAKFHSMWDRYANGHTGIAYELEIDKRWLIKNKIYAGKIKYIERDKLKISTESPEDVIQSGLFTKDVSFKPEREWRLIKFGTFEEFEGIDIGWELDIDVAGIQVNAIFTGLNMAKSEKSRISKICQNSEIEIFQMFQESDGNLSYEKANS